MKRLGVKIAAVFYAFTVVLTFSACGRTSSRYLGKDHRQILEVENMEKFINISFDKRGSSTVKDVTYLASDGYVYTKEFKDVSPIEGVIRWVPHDQDDSFIQSRTISRWTGKPTNLKLPEDCVKVLGVDVGYSSKNERTKNLYYLSTDGSILAKEYREGLIDRRFGGWLEVKAKK